MSLADYFVLFLIAATAMTFILKLTGLDLPLTRGLHAFVDGLRGVRQRLVGDSAYLVRVGSNVTTYTWQVKGRPAPPRREWKIDGLNLLGFSMAPNNPPDFDEFLYASPKFQQAAEVFQYVGGHLSTNNPGQILSPLFRNTPVKRGQAFWIRSGTLFNRYFGAFAVDVSNSKGLEFRDDLSTHRLRLRNATTNNLTVTVESRASEAPPTGQSSIMGAVPLLVRGNLSPTDLSYNYTHLPPGGSYSWTLAPEGQSGSEVEVVLGLNRAALLGNVGDLFAAILRFTDSLGHMQIDVPVSATVASRGGLWIGEAQVVRVQHYLKAYQRDGSNNLVTGRAGQYVVTNLDTSMGQAARAFPLRLIVHNPQGSGNAMLLQRVYYGMDAQTNLVVARQESAISSKFLPEARRISSTHLPWTSANTAWAFNGRLGEAANLATTVALDYNDHASNPFVHTYHPDHDNRDATFRSATAPGVESYTVRRDITLDVLGPANDFASLTAGGQMISGDYSETITMLGRANENRQFRVRGVFSVRKVSDVATLTSASNQ